MRTRNLYHIATIVCILLNVTYLSVQSQGTGINVPDDFAKIQDAINSSVDGDTIIVAPGTYYENVNFRGNNILLSSQYLFDEDISFINTTIIDGSKPQFPDTASVVSFFNGEKNTAIIAYCLVAIVGTQQKIERSSYEVLQVSGISLLDKIPVREPLTNMNYNDVKVLYDNQLSLNLF